MSAELATLAMALLAAAGFAIVTASALAGVWWIARPALQRGDPIARARRAFWLLVAPSLVPLGLVAICLAPGFLSLIGVGPDHCLQHTEHAHLCFTHPTAALTLSLGVLLGGVGLAVAIGIVWGSERLTRWHRQIRALHLGAEQMLAPDVHMLESPRPFSVTLGLAHPEIWISSALATSLSRAQLDAVLEHERAHARRRDSLRRLIANVLSLAHWPGVRRSLLDELALASEQACDEAAGHHVGDRLVVAEAILRVERMLATPLGLQHPALQGFGGSLVGARVKSLLDARYDAPSRDGLWWALALLLVVSVLLAGPLHHLTEHVLGHLIHVH